MREGMRRRRLYRERSSRTPRSQIEGHPRGNRKATSMKRLFLGVCGAAMLLGQANAEPLALTTTWVDNGWQKVRRHCDQRGRCWEESWRNPLLESYNFAPPPVPRAHTRTGRQRAAPTKG